MHADEVFLKGKLARIHEPHVRELNAFARRIPYKDVPYFDPADGGVNADILLLLEAPSAKATDFVSCDNNDQTAENLHQMLYESGLDRNRIILWNVVPFYIGNADKTKLRSASKVDLEMGRPYIIELLSLLVNIKTIVLMGRKAQRSFKMIQALKPDIQIIKTWHPSSLALNYDKSRRIEVISNFKSLAN
jgi:uracil-DNA glycosylase